MAPERPAALGHVHVTAICGSPRIWAIFSWAQIGDFIADQISALVGPHVGDRAVGLERIARAEVEREALVDASVASAAPASAVARRLERSWSTSASDLPSDGSGSPGHLERVDRVDALPERLRADRDAAGENWCAG